MAMSIDHLLETSYAIDSDDQLDIWCYMISVIGLSEPDSEGRLRERIAELLCEMVTEVDDCALVMVTFALKEIGRYSERLETNNVA